MAILAGSEIIPGQTLFFLDEIQECPRAILSLRYLNTRIIFTVHIAHLTTPNVADIRSRYDAC